MFYPLQIQKNIADHFCKINDQKLINKVFLIQSRNNKLKIPLFTMQQKDNKKKVDKKQMIQKGLMKNKTICILGFKGVLGKLLVKSISEQPNFSSDLFLISEQSNDKKTLKFINDSYFSKQLRQWIVNHVKFIDLKDLKNYTKNINLLINLSQPVEEALKQKWVDYHVMRTRRIVTELKGIGVEKCILVSSIYGQSPGYVTQSQSPEEYITSIPPHVNKQNFNDFMEQSFKNERQCWQWSIKFIENQYRKTTNKIEIIRVPALGPTLNSYEGYCDKFNQFTYFVYLMGTGFFTTLNSAPSHVTDLLPADYLVNYILVLISKTQETPKFRVHNLSTSSRNPITMSKLLSYLSQSWQQYEHKFLKPKITHKPIQKQLSQLKQTLPITVKQRLSKVFDIKQWKIQSQRSQIALQKKVQLAQKYEFFLQNEWICESNFSIDLYNELDEQQKDKFCFNVNHIDWKVYCRLICYAIKKHLLNHHVEDFQSTSMDLLAIKPTTSYFNDIIWALTEGKVVEAVNSVEIKNYILSTKAVKSAIKQLVEERMLKLENDPISYEKAQQELYKAADEICVQMFSQYNMKSIRLFAWFLHKIFKTIYQKVVVDAQALMKLRNHNQKELGPLIVIPTHRSYIDFLIMGYVFFGYKVKLPHIAAAEDFLGMAVIHVLMRNSGAFFIKRNQQKNKILYKAIMEEYINKTLANSHYLQFFIQGTRCRVGKMLPPKFGILSIVAKNVIQGRIPDAQILPVTLNYEKILEGQSFTYEMMGESKVKQSLTRLIKAVDTLKQNYGRIYIEFCPLISVKKYFQQQPNKTFNQTLQSLGYNIVYTLSDNLIITAPAILATVVLMYRKGISDDMLSEQVLWLCKEISSRGIKIARSQSDHSISISNTLMLLSDIVEKSKKNMFEVQVSLEQQSFVKLFTMTFYRNTLTHIFWEEAIVMMALISFGHQKIVKPKNVKLNELFNETKFLVGVFVKEYVLKGSLVKRQRFNEIISFLQNKRVINIEQEFVTLGKEGQPNGNYFLLYGSLTWPIIESYWITCLYLFKLQNQKPIPMQKLLSQIQWFAQSLISQRIITHLESISMDTIKNAVDSFILMKVIKKFNQQYKDGTKVSSVVLNIDQGMLKKLQQKIETFLKKSYAKSVKGILEPGQGSVNLDFPFLSKL